MKILDCIKLKQVLIVMLILILTSLYIFISTESKYISISTESKSSMISKDLRFPNITFYVRMGANPSLLQMFYCVMWRSAVFFYPGSFGKMVVVLDEENVKDHIFGDQFQKDVQENFPEWQVDVHYEELPANKLLDFEPNQRGLGYNRQLWNLFWMDNYTNDEIIAYVDTDSLFHAPLTKEYILGNNSRKLWVIGIPSVTVQNTGMMLSWDITTEKALGIKPIACFMTTFPQFVWRDTVINTRNHILNRFKTKNFAFAAKQFFGPHMKTSPINIVLNYAWHFERDRYNWHLNMPTEYVKQINILQQEKHRITLEDTKPTLVAVSHSKTWGTNIFTPGYCETMRAIGKPIKACQDITHDYNQACEMRVLQLPVRAHWPDYMHKWCTEAKEPACCKKTVLEHYENVARIPRTFHTFDIKKSFLVNKLAKKSGITCPKLLSFDPNLAH